MYHDYNGREIEDLEGDNMRRDSREEAQRNAPYYTLQWVLNVIQQIREADTPIDTGAVRFLLGVQSGVSDNFINCAIRFEQEIQDIVAKEVVTEKATYDTWLTDEMK